MSSGKDRKTDMVRSIREREIAKYGGVFNNWPLEEEKTMLKPLNNHCLIEVIDEYDGIIRDKQNEQVQKGVLQDYTLNANHLTTSTGYFIDGIEEQSDYLKTKQGKTVYWQEYADAGSKFEFDGKKYVLVPFYRLIGFEE